MELAKRVLLAPHNAVVDEMNDLITSRMPSHRATRTYLSTNTPDAYDVYDPTTAVFSIDNLQTINDSSMPVHKLTLRVGMPVMCLQNLDVAEGICNGTTMVVERLDPEVVWCRLLTRYGERLHPFAPTAFAYDNNGFKFTRIQMPMRVSFAATINRAQGGTYDRVAYHALRPIWAHGMFFTVITRPTTPDGLTILCDPRRGVPQANNPELLQGTTRNVVHPRAGGRAEYTVPSASNAQQPGHGQTDEQGDESDEELI